MITEGAEWKKALATKPHDPSSVIRIYIVEEANQFIRLTFTCAMVYTCAHTQTHNIVIVYIYIDTYG